MLKIFDYIFYRLTKLPGMPDPIGDSAAVLGTFQAFNLLTLLSFLFPILYTLPAIVLGIVLFSLFVIFSILNGFLGPLITNPGKYFKRLDKCEERWGNEPKKTKRLRGVLVIVYFLVSLATFMISTYLK